MAHVPDPAIVARLRAAGCVFAEDEALLLIAAAATTRELTQLVDRRTAGVPLEHVLGWVDFGGRRISVAPGVFVPRRRTELLARQAIAVARPHAVVLDLCCGSGALGVLLAAAIPGIDLYAADIDPAAVRCAQDNLAAAGGQVFQGDLFDALPQTLRGRVDIVVANAPYVPTEAIALMPPEARLHEPRVALDGGSDGLAVLHRVIAAAPAWLSPGGQLLFETSASQAAQAVAAVAGSGLTPQVAHGEGWDATVVIGSAGRSAMRP